MPSNPQPVPPLPEGGEQLPGRFLHVWPYPPPPPHQSFSALQVHSGFSGSPLAVGDGVSPNVAKIARARGRPNSFLAESLSTSRVARVARLSPTTKYLSRDLSTAAVNANCSSVSIPESI